MSAQHSFLVSLLSVGELATSLTSSDTDTDSTSASPAQPTISFIQDNALHLPCLLSKTWRKQQGWGDIDGMNGKRRWECTEIRGQAADSVDCKKQPSENMPSAPSLPQRQTSCSSVELERQLRRHNSQSSTDSASTSASSTARAPAPSSFQYPLSLGSLSSPSSCSSLLLHQVPEASATSFMNIPTKFSTPLRSDSNSTLESQRTSDSSSSHSLPVMPQRQLSEQSIQSQHLNGSTRRLIMTAPALPSAYVTKTNAQSLKQTSNHSQFTASTEASTVLTNFASPPPVLSGQKQKQQQQQQKQQQQSPLSSRQFNFPSSLYAAPHMPQRQESQSTLGSYSTLSTQDSFRSLASSSVANGSVVSTRTTETYRGSCPLVLQAMEAAAAAEAVEVASTGSASKHSHRRRHHHHRYSQPPKVVIEEDSDADADDGNSCNFAEIVNDPVEKFLWKHRKSTESSASSFVIAT